MFQLWFRSGIVKRKALESQIKGNDFTLQRKRALKIPNTTVAKRGKTGGWVYYSKKENLYSAFMKTDRKGGVPVSMVCIGQAARLRFLCELVSSMITK
jgi:hypothetical protein